VYYVCTQKHEISLTHIESRPSKQDSEHYDFFVDCVAGAQIEAAISDLQAFSRNVTVLTRSVDAAVADTGIVYWAHDVTVEYSNAIPLTWASNAGAV